MSLDDVLSIVVADLVAYRTSYAIMGGIAVRLYAQPRFTIDVDIVVGLKPGDHLALIQKLGESGFEVSEPFMKGWVDNVAGMPIVKLKRYHAGRFFDVDLFLTETPFQQSIISRRREIESKTGKYFFASPEDLVLLKLLAGRRRDMDDAHDILFLMGDLDDTYLRNWAEQIGVTDKLNTILDEFKD